MAKEIERYKDSLTAIKYSKSYKIGRVVTYVPRAIKDKTTRSVEDNIIP